eukprot:m.189802 g.189802  ORF g.189802 m.189802 type:complete len:1730 (+) comp10571_c0_seq2:2663-7852(+)
MEKNSLHDSGEGYEDGHEEEDGTRPWVGFEHLNTVDSSATEVNGPVQEFDETKTQLRVFDCGGQNEYADISYLFFAPHGMYLLCFDSTAPVSVDALWHTIEQLLNTRGIILLPRKLAFDSSKSHAVHASSTSAPGDPLLILPDLCGNIDLHIIATKQDLLNQNEVGAKMREHAKTLCKGLSAKFAQWFKKQPLVRQDELKEEAQLCVSEVGLLNMVLIATSSRKQMVKGVLSHIGKMLVERRAAVRSAVEKIIPAKHFRFRNAWEMLETKYRHLSNHALSEHHEKANFVVDRTAVKVMSGLSADQDVDEMMQNLHEIGALFWVNKQFALPFGQLTDFVRSLYESKPSYIDVRDDSQRAEWLRLARNNEITRNELFSRIADWRLFSASEKKLVALDISMVLDALLGVLQRGSRAPLKKIGDSIFKISHRVAQPVDFRAMLEVEFFNPFSGDAAGPLPFCAGRISDERLGDSKQNARKPLPLTDLHTHLLGMGDAHFWIKQMCGVALEQLKSRCPNRQRQRQRHERHHHQHQQPPWLPDGVALSDAFVPRANRPSTYLWFRVQCCSSQSCTHKLSLQLHFFLNLPEPASLPHSRAGADVQPFSGPGCSEHLSWLHDASEPFPACSGHCMDREAIEKIARIVNAEFPAFDCAGAACLKVSENVYLVRNINEGSDKKVEDEIVVVIQGKAVLKKKAHHFVIDGQYLGFCGYDHLLPDDLRFVELFNQTPDGALNTIDDQSRNAGKFWCQLDSYMQELSDPLCHLPRSIAHGRLSHNLVEPLSREQVAEALRLVFEKYDMLYPLASDVLFDKELVKAMNQSAKRCLPAQGKLLSRDQREELLCQLREKWFARHFTSDVVYSVDTLCEGFNVDKDLPMQLKTFHLHRHLGVEPHTRVSTFAEYIVFNARKQLFQYVVGIRNTDLLYHVLLAKPYGALDRLRNCFSMLRFDGQRMRGHEDHARHPYQACFSPEFYPRRYALKDPLYEQRLGTLDNLLDHVLSSYARNNVSYVEFSVGSNDILNPWVFRHLVDPQGLSVTARTVTYNFLFGFSRSLVHVKDGSSLTPEKAYEELEREANKDIDALLDRLLSDRENSPMYAKIDDILRKLRGKLKECLTNSAGQDQSLLLSHRVVGMDEMSDELGHPHCIFNSDGFIDVAREFEAVTGHTFGFRFHFGEGVPHSFSAMQSRSRDERQDKKLRKAKDAHMQIGMLGLAGVALRWKKKIEHDIDRLVKDGDYARLLDVLLLNFEWPLSEMQRFADHVEAAELGGMLEDRKQGLVQCLRAPSVHAASFAKAVTQLFPKVSQERQRKDLVMRLNGSQRKVFVLRNRVRVGHGVALAAPVPVPRSTRHGCYRLNAAELATAHERGAGARSSGARLDAAKKNGLNFLAWLAKRQIAIEVNITSNLFLLPGTAHGSRAKAHYACHGDFEFVAAPTDYHKHELVVFLEKSAPCVIATDNEGIFTPCKDQCCICDNHCTCISPICSSATRTKHLVLGEFDRAERQDGLITKQQRKYLEHAGHWHRFGVQFDFSKIAVHAKAPPLHWFETVGLEESNMVAEKTPCNWPHKKIMSLSWDDLENVRSFSNLVCQDLSPSTVHAQNRKAQSSAYDRENERKRHRDLAMVLFHLARHSEFLNKDFRVSSRSIFLLRRAVLDDDEEEEKKDKAPGFFTGLPTRVLFQELLAAGQIIFATPDLFWLEGHFFRRPSNQFWLDISQEHSPSGSEPSSLLQDQDERR